MDESSKELDSMRAAAKRAQYVFRNDPDRDAKVHDAVSLAWEFAQLAPREALANSIANFAIKRVLSGRQFRQSIRSIDSPKRGLKSTPINLELEAISRIGDDPAEIAVFRLTFLAWLEQLTSRQRAMLTALAGGDKTYEVAKQFDCSAGNVSQFRRRLAESWEAFTA